jgi:hypothetical protein
MTPEREREILRRIRFVFASIGIAFLTLSFYASEVYWYLILWMLTYKMFQFAEQCKPHKAYVRELDSDENSPYISIKGKCWGRPFTISI